MDAYDLLKPFFPTTFRPRNENRLWVGGLCPFHRETSPSFYLNRITGEGWCWKEHRKWSAEQLLHEWGAKRKEREEIVQQIGVIAKAAEPRLRRRMRKEEEKGLHILPVHLLGMFEQEPIPEDNPLRGFSPTLLTREEIGWDKDDRRITFPVRNEKGQLIAISGRALDPNKRPRYKFYGNNPDHPDVILQFAPEYVLRPKSTFWGAHQVLRGKKHLDYIILVEGFKARLAVIQAGYRNTLALMGSNLTEEQTRTLTRLDVPTYVFLDNNEAGMDGTMKVCETLSTQVRQVKVCLYPSPVEEAQPDDLTYEEVQRAVDNAVHYRQWRKIMGFQRRRAQYNAESKDRKPGGDYAAMEKVYRRNDQEIQLNHSRGIKMKPIALGIANPSDPAELIDTYPVRMHEDRGYFNKTKEERKGPLPRTPCSAGYNPEDPEPCNGCQASQDGNTTISKPRNFEIVSMAVLENFHYEHKKSQRGKEYDVVRLCEGRNCPHCRKGIPKRFGASRYLALGTNHFQQFLAQDWDIGQTCIHCRKPIYAVELQCENCGEVLHNFDNTDLTTEQITELTNTVTDCPKCKHRGVPLEILECEGGCKEPARTSIFDCTFRLKKMGEGTASALSFSDVVIEDLDEQTKHLREPLDVAKIFEPDTLEEQVQILGLKRNFYA